MVDEIHIDLTSGLDSRAILALVLSELDNKAIKTFTLGDLNNHEVKIARRISKEYNLIHSISTPQACVIDDFLKHSDLFAYFINGDSNSIRAVHPLPSFADMDTLVTGSINWYRNGSLN